MRHRARPAPALQPKDNMGEVVGLAAIDPWLLGLLVTFHLIAYLLFRLIYGDRHPKSRPSSTAAILAQFTTSITYACFTSVVGCWAWYGGEAEAIGGSARDRLYGRSELFQLLMVATAVYEVYNTALALVMPEYRSLDHVSHHAITCLLALFGGYPFLNYYGIFFFGVASLSSIPLCLIDLAECLGAERAELALKAIFAVLFLGFRTIYWPIVSFSFWSDCLSALRADTPGLQAHSTIAYSLFLFANAGLTGLQWFWTTKIVRGIAQAVAGEDKAKQKEQ